MEVYQILSLLGISSLSVALWGYLIAKIKKYYAETNAVKLGLQAILRDRLIQVYRVCTAQEYASITDRDNFMSATEALKYGLIDKIFDKR